MVTWSAAAWKQQRQPHSATFSHTRTYTMWLITFYRFCFIFSIMRSTENFWNFNWVCRHLHTLLSPPSPFSHYVLLSKIMGQKEATYSGQLSLTLQCHLSCCHFLLVHNSHNTLPQNIYCISRPELDMHFPPIIVFCNSQHFSQLFFQIHR